MHWNINHNFSLQSHSFLSIQTYSIYSCQVAIFIFWKKGILACKHQCNSSFWRAMPELLCRTESRRPREKINQQIISSSFKSSPSKSLFQPLFLMTLLKNQDKLTMNHLWERQSKALGLALRREKKDQEDFSSLRLPADPQEDPMELCREPVQGHWEHP